MDRNQELLARIRQLQEREATAEEKMREQLERHRLCKQSLDAASQQLREREDGLAAAMEVSAGLCLGPRLTLTDGCFLRRAPVPITQHGNSKMSSFQFFICLCVSMPTYGWVHVCLSMAVRSKTNLGWFSSGAIHLVFIFNYT